MARKIDTGERDFTHSTLKRRRRPAYTLGARGSVHQVKALGSNSLKCPVARKKPLRLKNTPCPHLCVCTHASASTTQSIAFRVLFLSSLGIILVFMVPIKVHCRSFSFSLSRFLTLIFTSRQSFPIVSVVPRNAWI